jgi:hypothetical protein
MSYKGQVGKTEAKAIIEAAEDVLDEMFTETGKETVIYYLQINHSLKLTDIYDRPARFQEVLVKFLGEFGGELILRRVIQRLTKIPGPAYGSYTEDMSLEDAVKKVVKGSGIVQLTP